MGGQKVTRTRVVSIEYHRIVDLGFVLVYDSCKSTSEFSQPHGRAWVKLSLNHKGSLCSACIFTFYYLAYEHFHRH